MVENIKDLSPAGRRLAEKAVEVMLPTLRKVGCGNRYLIGIIWGYYVRNIDSFSGVDEAQREKMAAAAVEDKLEIRLPKILGRSFRVRLNEWCGKIPNEKVKRKKKEKKENGVIG